VRKKFQILGSNFKRNLQSPKENARGSRSDGFPAVAFEIDGCPSRPSLEAVALNFWFGCGAKK
jgi:hypothetical protein